MYVLVFVCVQIKLFHSHCHILPEYLKLKLPGSCIKFCFTVLQKGNPLLRFIRNVPHTYSDIVPDYVMSPKNCALFLRYVT